MAEKENIYIYLKENFLPEGRNGETAAERKRLSHTLLREAASLYLVRCGRICGENAAEAERWQLEEGPYGKPRFVECPDLHFSISHSGSCWCCAFSTSPIGLDIQAHGFGKGALPQEAEGERLRLRMQRISDRFFHPYERLWLENGGDFFAVWAAKESYVKYTGEGMHRSFDSFAVADENGLLPFVKGEGAHAQLRKLPAPAGYSLCLCAERIGVVEIFQM